MTLRDFTRESLAIEGITREPTNKEVRAHQDFLALPELRVPEVECFVAEIAGERAKLRRRRGMDVRVGSHFPPPGGPEIERKLTWLLVDINFDPDLSPWKAHVEYEALHPFLDGNGRSGRAIWAWMMQREGRDPFKLGFLRAWYYASLDEGRRLPS